jgi:hypothetical protein
MNAIAIVSGLPRSGTSLMMRMLAAGGVPPISDGEREADIDNPRGYYEYEPVKKLAQNDAWVDNAPGKAVKVISALLPHLPSRHPYKVVFMRRDLDEILASQSKMLERRGEPQGDEALLRRAFMKHVEVTEQWLGSQDNVDVLYVSYTRLVTAPERQLDRLMGFFEDLDRVAMQAVIEPGLYRQRRA